MGEVVSTRLKLIDNYKFKTAFNGDNYSGFLVDEQKPIGEGAGPTPIQLLSTAIGHCLSSSLVFCLKKTRIKAETIETTVEARLGRNREGRLRVKAIHVRIHLKVQKEDETRLPTCLRIFEKYCVVTKSVIKGIPVTHDFG